VIYQVDWCYIQWLWMTSDPYFKRKSLLEVEYIGNYVSYSYNAIYRMVSFVSCDLEWPFKITTMFNVNNSKMLQENRVWYIKWCHFQWLSITRDPDFKGTNNYSTLNISETVQAKDTVTIAYWQEIFTWKALITIFKLIFFAKFS